MLNNLSSPKTKQRSKRIGRGVGTGVGGHTVGRGQKGQKSRSGYSIPRQVFEGGGMPINRRLRKLKGFSRRGLTYKNLYLRINLSDLNKLEEGTEVTMENLKELGLVRNNSRKMIAKILGKGELTKKITVKGIPSSKVAAEAIEKAGGKVILE